MNSTVLLEPLSWAAGVQGSELRPPRDHPARQDALPAALPMATAPSTPTRREVLVQSEGHEDYGDKYDTNKTRKDYLPKRFPVHRPEDSTTKADRREHEPKDHPLSQRHPTCLSLRAGHRVLRTASIPPRNKQHRRWCRQRWRQWTFCRPSFTSPLPKDRKSVV